VLDIDGTVLINGDDNDSRTRCVLWFTQLCQACEQANISIFCVTARPNSDHGQNRRWTEVQLKKCGVTPVKQLFMRPTTAEYTSYKYRCRQRIRREGYQILLSIGDQFADLSAKLPRDLDDHSVLVGTLGDNGEYAIKLPSEYK
jgi:hypothetical protein